MTLSKALATYPDAKEVSMGSQSVVTKAMAIEAAYGKPVETKCLFDRVIHTPTQVKYYFIFSVKALQEEKEMEVER
ncbi:MAG: hypothetical protein H7Y13_12010 [Sphingobacteriaceae bacterium]|nr:hypothetical protein [Sphingobacteriaceae bacterium]